MSGFSIKGHVFVDYYDNFGNFVRSTDPKKNVITDLGLQEFLKMLVGVGRNPSHIEVGTGVTPVDKADTVIETPIPPETLPLGGGLEREYNDGRGKLDVVGLLPQDFNEPLNITRVEFKRFLEETDPDPNNQVNTTSQTNLNGKTITEAGLFNRWKSGVMLSHVILDDVIEKLPGLNPAVRWQYEMRPDETLNGQPNIITDKGVELFGRAIIGRDTPKFQNKTYMGLDGYINEIAVGDGNTGAPQPTDLNLVMEIPGDGRLPPTRCEFDFSDVDKPIVRFQRLVTFAMVGDADLTEAGLFHKHLERGNFPGQKTTINDMFSKVLIDPALTVSSSEDQVLTWEVSLRRG